jgi:hypothetical protein
MSKYHRLTEHLAARKQARVRMRFDEIEAVLGFALPKSARAHRPWWANTGHGHAQAKGWLAAGYRSSDVDLKAEELLFQKLNMVEGSGPEHVKTPRRHPLFGAMAGMITPSPGVDLTEPVYDDGWDWLDAKADRINEGLKQT